MTQESVTLKKIPQKEKEGNGQTNFFQTHFFRYYALALYFTLRQRQGVPFYRTKMKVAHIYIIVTESKVWVCVTVEIVMVIST